MKNVIIRIYAISLNTFIEAIRNRAFIGLLIMALSFIIFSIVLSELAISDQRERVLKDFGLFAISTFSVFIAVILGVILIYKEVEKKTFYTILPKPVRRYEVIIGKYIGLIVILLILLIVLTIAWLMCLLSKNVPLSLNLIKALILIFFEVSMITATALLFSSFSSPILSGIFTFGIFLIGRTLFIIEEILHAKKGIIIKAPLIKSFAEIVTKVFPDLQVFNVSREIILGIDIGGKYILSAFGYSLCYSMLFLIIAILLFERRDFV